MASPAVITSPKISTAPFVFPQGVSYQPTSNHQSTHTHCRVMFIGQSGSDKSTLVQSVAEFLGYDEKSDDTTVYEIPEVSQVTGCSITIEDGPSLDDTPVPDDEDADLATAMFVEKVQRVNAIYFVVKSSESVLVTHPYLDILCADASVRGKVSVIFTFCDGNVRPVLDREVREQFGQHVKQYPIGRPDAMPNHEMRGSTGVEVFSRIFASLKLKAPAQRDRASSATSTASESLHIDSMAMHYQAFDQAQPEEDGPDLDEADLDTLGGIAEDQSVAPTSDFHTLAFSSTRGHARTTSSASSASASSSGSEHEEKRDKPKSDAIRDDEPFESDHAVLRKLQELACRQARAEPQHDSSLLIEDAAESNTAGAVDQLSLADDTESKIIEMAIV